MNKEQLEFPFAKEIDAEEIAEEEDREKIMEEISNEAKYAFVELMAKYKISKEDSQTIWLTANQFPS